MNEERNTIVDQAEQYVKTNMELYTLRLTGKIATVVSSLVTKLVISLLALIVVFMIGLGLAFWLGELLGHDYLGLIIIGGAIGIVTLFLYSRRDKMIRKPLMDNIISDILK